VRGELKVEPLTDFPQRFEGGSELWLDGTAYAVERGRWQRRQVILKLRGIETRDQAEALQGKTLLAPAALELEDEGVYYLHDILGAAVLDEAGETLGEVAEVLATGSNDVYVVRGPKGELLLPALDDVVLAVDVKARRITVAVPQGLEFSAPAKPRRGGRRRA
jgi:16S rRNA processing protein RimM